MANTKKELYLERGCDDCGTEEIDLYMVHDWLWEAVVKDEIETILCIPCLESRLNVTLTKEFFTAAPCNDPAEPDPAKSEIFLDRLMRFSERQKSFDRLMSKLA